MDDQFIYRLGSSSTYLPRPPTFYRNSELLKSGSRFASVYAVREEDAKALQEAGTAFDFRGIVWSSRLWIDFDNEAQGQSSWSRIKELGYDATLYHTGNRGYHIGIYRPTRCSHLLPRQDKAWVQANMVGADLSLYWHLHLIRLPGTIHEKTGKPKVFIEYSKGKPLMLPMYEGISQQQSNLISRVSTQEGSIFQKWNIQKNLTPNGGSRHKQLMDLSVSLAKNTDVSQERALWLVNEVNRGFIEPKSLEEIDRIVKWAYEQV